MREDPRLLKLLNEGVDEPSEAPICPECGKECEYVFIDRYGFVVGCDECLTKRNAYEDERCFVSFEE